MDSLSVRCYYVQVCEDLVPLLEHGGYRHATECQALELFFQSYALYKFGWVSYFHINLFHVGVAALNFD